MIKLLVRKVASRVFQFSLLIASFFIPEQKNLVVFSMARGRYWDNSKALFEFLVDRDEFGLSVFWLSDPDLDLEKIPKHYRHKVVPRNSVAGWLLVSKARIAIISHGTGDFGIYGLLVKHKKLINLWHGIAIKYIGFLDKKISKNMKKKYIKREVSYYDKMIVSSDIERYYWSAANRLEVEKIVITGMPRNDQLVRESYNASDMSKIFDILYAPTFRDYKIGEESVFFNFNVSTDEIEKWAIKNEIRFILRPHPNDSASVNHVKNLCVESPNVFVDATVNKMPDVQPLLLKCNGLVTDYSSIYIDALLGDKPVVFTDFDRDEYLKTRGLAWDYDLVTPGPKVRTWPEFQQACEEMITGAEKWAEHREFVRKMFFKYRDDNSCERVAEVIKKMVKN